MKDGHNNISNNLHSGRIVLVPVVKFPKDVKHGEGGVAGIDNPPEPSNVSGIKEIDGCTQILGMECHEFARQIHTYLAHLFQSLPPDQFTGIELEIQCASLLGRPIKIRFTLGDMSGKVEG